MSFDEDTTEQHERRITRCRSCNAKVIWFETPKGKNMPVDADTVEAGDEALDLSRHVSHFRTCPNADKHRKPR
jgi:hypothetical protein